MIKFIKVN